MPLSTKDIKPDSTNLFLFVGPADAGKSFAATSFGLKSKAFGGDDPRPCYMLELDNRIAALRNRPVEYDTFTNEEGAIGVLNRVIALREACVKMKAAPFHTLILDSATSLGDMAVADSMDTKTSAGRKIGELKMLTVEDYGYEAETWRQVLWENLIDIKRYANVIVTAHETKQYREVKGPPGSPAKSVWDGEYKLLMHGNKIADKLPTKFDEVYHFMAKEVVVSQKNIRRSVVFQDNLARTSYPKLASSTASYDISGKEFYTFWCDLIK